MIFILTVIVIMAQVSIEIVQLTPVTEIPFNIFAQGPVILTQHFSHLLNQFSSKIKMCN